LTDELLRAGATIDGRFELVRTIGRGGMGVVWLAKDTQQGNEEIALKLLHPKFADSASAVERMTREAEALKRLDHPNISRPIAFAAQKPVVYLAMEYVDGVPLHEMLGARNGVPLPLPAVARIFDELARAVAYAHGKGVVHRDLKPQNVMIVARDGVLFVKVLDFGVAKFLEDNSTDGTTQGRTIGSLFYLSPEQTRGDPAVTASDIFALGTMLFELLTARRMWAKDRSGAQLTAFNVPLLSDGVNALTEVVERICRGTRPKATDYRSDLSPQLDGVVARAVAMETSDRHPTAEALRAEALAHLTPAEKQEMTMVQPVEAGDEEELITTRGRDKSRTLTIGLAAPRVPTRAVEGGVSSFFDKTRAEGIPLVSVPDVDPTKVVARPVPASAIVPPPMRVPPPMIAAAIGIAFILVASTYLITRASYENTAPPPPVPVATTAPEPAPVGAIPAAETPSPVEVATPAPSPSLAPALRRKVETPAPKPVAQSALAGLLTRAQAAPSDSARLIALSKAIESAAAKVPDPEARTTIVRVARQSASMSDVSGLEEAYNQLTKALERAGEPVP